LYNDTNKDGKSKMNLTRYYQHMFTLLVGVWESHRKLFPDELPGWLGSMNVLPNGTSADAAMLDDWLDLFDSENISHDRAYDSIETYLKRYMSSSSEWRPLLEILHQESTKAIWKSLITTNSKDE
jgi:hypothetical protein